MTYPMNTAAEQYRAVGVRAEVEAATPHRLIQLLMERFLTKVSVARRHMENGNIPAKGEAISAAISIVNGLQASLNHEPDAELSGNFDALYDYMQRRLLESNLRNEPEGLAEVASLMEEIKSAWDMIGERTGGRQAVRPNSA
jgi:flagellar protein FliS